MPTPDASAFTRQSKLRAFQGQTRDNNVKVLSHLYQPIIRTSGLTDFLPSFSNKVVAPTLRPLPWSKSAQGPNVAYIDKKRIH
jgi:hypothetical protein